MKVKTNKEDLLQALLKTQNIVSLKSTLPILSNILIETKKDALMRIYATDLDIGVSCELPVDIINEGAITVPAKKFTDIIKELPSGELFITVKKNNHIEIEKGSCIFKLIGLPKEEFPKFPEFKNVEVFSLDQKMLKEMIQMTSFAVSHEDSRYILNGVLLEIEDQKIRLVATDGRRLAKIERELKMSHNKELKVIIPIKAIQEINRNLKEEGTLSFLFNNNQILFDINHVLIVTRVIEGDFPDYHQVIKKIITSEEKVKEIVLSASEFLFAIRRASLLTTPDFQAVKFEVFKNKLVISKITPDVGESREEISIEYGGSEMIVGFNPGFFLDVLKNISEEKLTLKLLGSDQAGVIRLDQYLYLVQPMRI